MLSVDQIAEKLKGLSFAEAAAKLGEFDSCSRSVPLVFVFCRSPTPEDTVRAFLEWGNVCDAPWSNRTTIAHFLRRALHEVKLADHLAPPERKFYDALPTVISVWRGCERDGEGPALDD